MPGTRIFSAGVDDTAVTGAATVLELHGVTKRYSGIPAVADISFSARPGEVTGYLGPNGSGKSTTIKMITGLIEPSDGEILFCGEPIDRNRRIPPAPGLRS